MVSQSQLIKILEDSIEGEQKLGAKYRTGSDDYFWWEADLQSRLLCFLWSNSMMWHEFEHGGKRRRLPLAHAEIPTRADTQKKYDLALFEPEIAKDIVTVDFQHGKDYGKRVAKRQALAVVELKLIHYPWYFEKLQLKPGDRDPKTGDKLVRREPAGKETLDIWEHKSPKIGKVSYIVAIARTDRSGRIVNRCNTESEANNLFDKKKELIGQASSTGYHQQSLKQLEKRIGEDIEKLEFPENKKQVTHRYLFIGCNTRKMDKPGQQHCDVNVVNSIKDWIKNRCYGTGIKVYFASDHPQDSPTWLQCY